MVFECGAHAANEAGGIHEQTLSAQSGALARDTEQTRVFLAVTS